MKNYWVTISWQGMCQLLRDRFSHVQNLECGVCLEMCPSKLLNKLINTLKKIKQKNIYEVFFHKDWNLFCLQQSYKQMDKLWPCSYLVYFSLACLAVSCIIYIFVCVCVLHSVLSKDIIVLFLETKCCFGSCWPISFCLASLEPVVDCSY